MKYLKDKKSLIAIIVLLALFFPPTFFASLKKIKEHKNKPDNQKIQEGYLYFNDNDLYLGKYKCKIPGCSLARTSEDSYFINSFKNGNKTNLGIIDSKYVFINDLNKILLYSINLENEITSFQEVKFYNSNLENNLLLTSKDGKWGAISLSNFSVVIKHDYDFLGLANRLNEVGELKTDILIARKNDKFMLINDKEEVLTAEFSILIYDFDDKHVILKSNNYKVFDYEGNEIFDNLTIVDIYLLDDKYIVLDNENIYIFENYGITLFEKKSKEEEISVIKDSKTYIIKEVDNKLKIVEDK